MNTVTCWADRLKFSEMTEKTAQAVEHIASHPERHICAACLARELGLSRNSAYDVARRLEGRREFVREYGVCSACRSDRMVLRTRNGNSPRQDGIANNGR